MMMYQAGILLCLLPAVAFAVNCENVAEDGNYEIGCKSYVICYEGKKELLNCGTNQVYDLKEQECGDMDTVEGPCGKKSDCSSLANQKYADTDNKCETYFTCLNGTFLGRNFCSPTTVFDEKNQLCNFPRNVLPPCGTKKMEEEKEEEDDDREERRGKGKGKGKRRRILA